MIVAHLVTKNEAYRYLNDCLRSLAALVDHIHVFDDLSTDGTPQLAEGAGAEVHVCSSDCPSFLEHEGQFRQAAWEAMGTLPQDSWVVCVDADEFFTEAVRPLAEGENKAFKVREVFDVVDGHPMVRIDGYWDRVTAARLARWTPESEFPDLKMGCGSLPEAIAGGHFELVDHPQILHMGYARDVDRHEKYSRYKKYRGHNPNHVESILHHGHLRPL